MEFVTVHDLSRELDVSARVIRYHLAGLIAAGKLEKDKDFRQEDFKDPLHFEWKINPVSFMRESGLKPKTPPQKIVNEMGNEPVTTANNPVNERLTKTEKLVNEPPPSVTRPPQPVNESVNQSEALVSLHREMIDVLKDQIRVKDGQISEQTKQLKEMHELNVKLNTAMLRQGDEIKNLLRLTGGKTEMSEMVNKDRQGVSNADNQNSPLGNKTVNGTGESANENETAMAA